MTMGTWPCEAGNTEDPAMEASLSLLPYCSLKNIKVLTSSCLCIDYSIPPFIPFWCEQIFRKFHNFSRNLTKSEGLLSMAGPTNRRNQLINPQMKRTLYSSMNELKCLRMRKWRTNVLRLDYHLCTQIPRC